MAILTVDERYGSKDAAFFHAHRGPKNTVYPITPWVLTHHLAALGLSTPEQLVCRALLDYKYSLAMAKMDLGELAQEIGRSIRQVQRVIKKLKERDLINVTPRPGRPSIIDVMPLVAAVKKLLAWEEEQPAPVETLTEVAPIRRVSDEQFWSQAATSEPEDALAMASWKLEVVEEEPDPMASEIWDDIKLELKKRVPYEAFRNHLDDTAGVGSQGETLLVEAKAGSIGRLGDFKGMAELLLNERWNGVSGVAFVPAKKKPKKKKLGPLARLAVAAVGV